VKNKYSIEFYEWLSKNYKGSSKDLIQKINEKFGYDVTYGKLYNIRKHLINLGYEIGSLNPGGNPCGRFRSGMPTWKMLNESKPGTIRRRKKGNFIKLENGKWGPYYKYVYENYYGETPKGFIIHHINGNIYDDRIENLAQLSRPIHNYLIGRQLWFNDREQFMTACLLAELAIIKPHYIRPSKRKGKSENDGEQLLIQSISN